MKRIAIFFGTLAICAGLAWLGGYNFDTRGGWVATCTFLSLYVAFSLAVLGG